MNKEVIVIGASGHGKVIADIIQQSGDRVIGFLDDDRSLPETFIGLPVLDTTDFYEKYQDYFFIIAIGNMAIREKMTQKMQGVRWYTAIHPSAVVSDKAVSVGEGTAVMPNAVINAGATIGKHCIINSSAVVEHDNVIDDFAHISVGAKLGGTVRIGQRSWIGIGACVRNNIFICADCMIGAGAVVVKNIQEAGTYIGVPAKKRHSF